MAVLGEHSRYYTDGTEVTTRIQRVIPHPDFHPFTFQNDIALLQTAEEIPFSENIAPICPPDRSVDYTYHKAVISGWGAVVNKGQFMDK